MKMEKVGKVVHLKQVLRWAKLVKYESNPGNKYIIITWHQGHNFDFMKVWDNVNF